MIYTHGVLDCWTSANQSLATSKRDDKRNWECPPDMSRAKLLRIPLNILLMDMPLMKGIRCTHVMDFLWAVTWRPIQWREVHIQFISPLDIARRIPQLGTFYRMAMLNCWLVLPLFASTWERIGAVFQESHDSFVFWYANGAWGICRFVFHSGGIDGFVRSGRTSCLCWFLYLYCFVPCCRYTRTPHSQLEAMYIEIPNTCSW